MLLGKAQACMVDLTWLGLIKSEFAGGGAVYPRFSAHFILHFFFFFEDSSPLIINLALSK